VPAAITQPAEHARAAQAIASASARGFTATMLVCALLAAAAAAALALDKSLTKVNAARASRSEPYPIWLLTGRRFRANNATNIRGAIHLLIWRSS
jgi:hypothetical protein